MLIAGLALQRFSNAKLPEQMDWWRVPRITLDSADRLGLSRDRILAMGIEKWSRLAFSKRQGSKERSLALGIDGSVLVFGACLYDRNQGILNSRSASERKGIERLRSELYQYGMSCIGLESVLAGGGTYDLHMPKTCYLQTERVLYRVLTYSGPDLGSKSAAEIRGRFKAYRQVKKPVRLPFGDLVVAVPTVRAWTARADRHFDAVSRELPRYSPARQSYLRRFLWTWADYLAIRGTG